MIRVIVCSVSEQMSPYNFQKMLQFQHIILADYNLPVISCDCHGSMTLNSLKKIVNPEGMSLLYTWSIIFLIYQLSRSNYHRYPRIKGKNPQTISWQFEPRETKYFTSCAHKILFWYWIISSFPLIMLRGMILNLILIVLMMIQLGSHYFVGLKLRCPMLYNFGE